MISVVVFKWAKPGYRSTFLGQHVNTMHSMVARHYPEPHRFICITDDPQGIDPGIEIVPLWTEHAELLNPTWPREGPSCYRRLRAFSKEFEQIAGPRFVCVDLDVVITGDLRPLWNRPEDFVIYASDYVGNAYNGSMWMMTAGARAQVWEKFHPVESPKATKAARIQGSDQAWIQYALGPNEAKWTSADGVVTYQRHCLRFNDGRLPPASRVVLFHGRVDPWSTAARVRSPWVTEHYR